MADLKTTYKTPALPDISTQKIQDIISQQKSTNQPLDNLAITQILLKKLQQKQQQQAGVNPIAQVLAQLTGVKNGIV